MNRCALIITTAIFSIAASAAGTWERIEMPAGAGYWEIDKASITPTPEGTKRLLVRLSFTSVQKDSEGTAWDHAVMVAEVDCGKRAWRAVDVVSYLRAERVTPRRTSSDWTQAGPKSVMYGAA